MNAGLRDMQRDACILEDAISDARDAFHHAREGFTRLDLPSFEQLVSILAEVAVSLDELRRELAGLLVRAQ